MLFKAFLVTLFVAYSAADVVNSVPCANETLYAENYEMEVTGCTTAHESCQLVKGKSHEVIFRFTPTRDFVGYTQFKVFGVFKDLTVPYGRTSNACQNATVIDTAESCQSKGGFKQGTRYIHQSNFGVSRTYPSVKLRVRFAFIDRRSKTKMLCLEVPVELVEPPASA